MCISPDNTEGMSVRAVWLSNELWKEVDVLARVKDTTSSGALRLILSEWRAIHIPRFESTTKTGKSK